MIQLARMAARYFDYAEIVESHQQLKVDSPSGTAVAMARAMVEGHGGPFEHTMPDREPITGSRGADHEGVAIHSQRMPGFVAHHEISFGGIGQTLRIRHDSTGRESFMPGVLLACKRVRAFRELVYGTHWLGPCSPKGNAPQHYVMTVIATSVAPNELPAGLTKAELLKALEGGKALRAASLSFRFWQ